MRQGRRTVHIGHHDVQQDQVGRPIRGHREGIPSRGATADREVRVETERYLDHLSDVRLVVDMKYAYPAHFTSLSGYRRYSFVANVSIFYFEYFALLPTLCIMRSDRAADPRTSLNCR